MKICPRCQKTYSDDSLNFCLDDGSVLSQMAGEAPQTVMLNEPRLTSQPPPFATQQSGTAPQWNVQQGYSMQPPVKKSRTWIWVLLILGALVILCGGGFGLLAYIGMQADKNDNANKGWSNNNGAPPPSGRTNLTTVDLSKWLSNTAPANIEYTGGELIMATKQKDYYYVHLALPQSQFGSTEKSDLRVTLRNVDGSSGKLGYGLVFLSDPQPLHQDYAFVIDTMTQKYRVVRHVPQDEKDVIAWTSSPEINNGKSENVLEARDQGDTVDLYINGTKVTTLKNTNGFKGGAAGLYVGDSVRVAFKNMELRR